MNQKYSISSLIREYSSSLNYRIPHISIILAAGHGKRIKSSTSKVLYEIWGVPTVIKVSKTAQKGIFSPNQIIVVGIKAEEVVKTIGKKKNTCFVYQKEQNGTGDAVKVALEAIDKKFKGVVYIFPADAGLITEDIIQNLKAKFENSNYDMIVLTGKYTGEVTKNHYGRVIKDRKKEEVIEIKEYKDIAGLKGIYKIVHEGKALSFTREELLKMEEFNSGIYAFKTRPLRECMPYLKSDNIQKEYYLTDIVRIFNNRNLNVGSQMIEDSSSLLGFNDRATLKEMDKIARQRVYDQLKGIVTFQDPEDFFIAEEVVNNILKMDKEGILVDLDIGKGARLNSGVILNKDIKIGRNSELDGNIILQEGIKIGEGVKILGNDKYPVKVGKNVTIRGITYIFGCIIDNDVYIECCILEKKHIKKKPVMRYQYKIQ